ncbi:phage major capsid protein [Ruegeria sp. R13_0]|uniref:phage major capsid protein n=1 Tax=Ruegeria sp. R13_0 TaxID=2821099 RepID=UPI001ADB1064|nr:phage major capsid protein [Ruegeria sp. R13_0]MBO9434520.1 phage major capsid protein [Ruegeria sp. R13_0]
MLHQRFKDQKTPAFGPEISADAKLEEGDRLVRLSFSSEIPVLRNTEMGPAYEVLGHEPSEVDLVRLNSGSAPVLKDHRRDVDSMVGTVVSAQIEDRRGRAVVRLADTKEGNSMLSRIEAGEVQSVSVGYAVHELKPAGEPNGYVPTAVLAGRNLVTTTNASSLIGTQQMHDAFIEVLKPQVRVMELGATVLPGLVENVSIPRQTAGCSAEWIEENAEATESTPGFDAVTLTMHQLSANTRISRRQLKQSLPAVDQRLSNDLRAQIAVALDKAAIAGSGVAEQPTGILNQTGIGSVELGADGDLVTWAKLMELVSKVESANVDPATLGFLSNLKVKGYLMSTPRIAGTDTMMLDPDAAATAEDLRLAGYKARFSGNVPSDLTKGSGTDLSAVIFGAWEDFLIGQWGGIDLIVDDATEAAKGNVRLVAHSEWDIAARHAESFAAIQDIQTP